MGLISMDGYWELQYEALGGPEMRESELNSISLETQIYQPPLEAWPNSSPVRL